MVSYDNIEGKYCLVQGVFDLPETVSDHGVSDSAEWPDPESSVWSALRMASLVILLSTSLSHKVNSALVTASITEAKPIP